MNPPINVRFRKDPVSRSVEVFIYRPGYRMDDIECLQLFSIEGDTPALLWEDVAEGVRAEPFMVLSDEVFAALEEAVLGDTKHHDSILQGKVEVLQETLAKERERVDRLLP